jgi:hypothetical protein
MLNAPVMIARIAQKDLDAVAAQLKVEMPSEVNINKELAVNAVIG